MEQAFQTVAKNALQQEAEEQLLVFFLNVRFLFDLLTLASLDTWTTRTQFKLIGIVRNSMVAIANRPMPGLP